MARFIKAVTKGSWGLGILGVMQVYMRLRRRKASMRCGLGFRSWGLGRCIWAEEDVSSMRYGLGFRARDLGFRN